MKIFHANFYSASVLNTLTTFSLLKPQLLCYPQIDTRPQQWQFLFHQFNALPLSTQKKNTGVLELNQLVP